MWLTQLIRGCFTCMAHCLFPPGEVHRQKNHFRSLEQLSRVESPCFTTVPFTAGSVETILDSTKCITTVLWPRCLT